MLITVNLLPGANKPSALKADVDVAKLFRSLSGSIRDPLLVGSIGATVAAVAAVGWMFSAQSARAQAVAEKLEAAIADSSRLSSAITAQRRLSAERDSVERNLAIIRSIDETRYQWAHILDEVSRALPAYTWLVSIDQTSKPPRAPEPDSAAVAAAGAAADGAAAPPAVPPSVPLVFKITGQTIDIQALTLFMRQLEASPFIAWVTLVRSEITVVEGKDVTQFELSASYESPPPGVAQVTPLVIPVR
jgi:Tfp pilus assembly protein PilN